MGTLARFTTVAALTLVCAAALAAPECTQAPKDKWMAEKYMKAELEEQGYKIKRFTEEGDAPHEIAGCIALGLAVARLVWGFTGTHYARFSQFVPRPSALLSYMMAMVKGREARFLGHNPAGAFMMLALLVMVLAASASG